MSAAHTPGPWFDYTEPHGTRHILPCPVPTLNTVQICTFGGTAYRSKIETDANARLLAAAPELLAALENLIETTPSDIDCEDNLEKYRSFVLRVACAAVADVRDDSNNGRAPGDPGPAPDGVTYSDWLAFNNID